MAQSITKEQFDKAIESLQNNDQQLEILMNKILEKLTAIESNKPNKRSAKTDPSTSTGDSSNDTSKASKPVNGQFKDDYSDSAEFRKKVDAFIDAEELKKLSETAFKNKKDDKSKYSALAGKIWTILIKPDAAEDIKKFVTEYKKNYKDSKPKTASTGSRSKKSNEGAKPSETAKHEKDSDEEQ